VRIGYECILTGPDESGVGGSREFYAFSFMRLMARHTGKGRGTPWCIVCREGDELIGIIPLFLGPQTVSRFRVSHHRAYGSVPGGSAGLSGFMSRQSRQSERVEAGVWKCDAQGGAPELGIRKRAHGPTVVRPFLERITWR